MILVGTGFDGKPEQEVELQWDGPSGWTIVLRIREWDGDEKVEASAALDPTECRALAANLLQMADRFERER